MVNKEQTLDCIRDEPLARGFWIKPIDVNGITEYLICQFTPDRSEISSIQIAGCEVDTLIDSLSDVLKDLKRRGYLG